MSTPPTSGQRPPEAGTIITNVRAAGIIALVYGIILICVGAATLIFLVGVVPLIFGTVNILIYRNCKEIESMIESGDYRGAKEKHSRGVL